MMKKTKRFFTLFAALASITPAFSDISFNALAGATASFSSDSKNEKFDPKLEVQTFFAGQMNLSENLILHGEFTVKTGDLIENSVFNETDAKFQIDEISLVLRTAGIETKNYFSVFMGTYEPIGSDIFLRRHFGIQPIASKLTESWLGTAGSVIYPLVGAGFSDIVQFDRAPVALGFYTYVNHELDDSFVFNIDGRLSMAYRYLKLDISTGIGTPLNTSYYENAYFVINKLYWRAGVNLLLGNPHNASIFVQAGASEIPFSKNNTKISVSDIDAYLLLEPRFNFSAFCLHLTAWNLPSKTVGELLFIDNTLGANMNIFSDDFFIKDQSVIIGLNASVSFPEKNYLDLQRFNVFFQEDFDVCIAPYASTKILNGDLNIMAKVNVMDIIKDKWYKGFGVSVGYKTQF